MVRLKSTEDEEKITLCTDFEKNKNYARQRKMNNTTNSILIFISDNSCTISYRPPAYCRSGNYANSVSYNQPNSTFVNEFSKTMDALLNIANRFTEKFHPDAGKNYGGNKNGQLPGDRTSTAPNLQGMQQNKKENGLHSRLQEVSRMHAQEISKKQSQHAAESELGSLFLEV